MCSSGWPRKKKYRVCKFHCSQWVLPSWLDQNCTQLVSYFSVNHKENQLRNLFLTLSWRGGISIKCKLLSIFRWICKIDSNGSRFSPYSCICRHVHQKEVKFQWWSLANQHTFGTASFQFCWWLARVVHLLTSNRCSCRYRSSEMLFSSLELNNQSRTHHNSISSLMIVVSLKTFPFLHLCYVLQYVWSWWWVSLVNILSYIPKFSQKL